MATSGTKVTESAVELELHVPDRRLFFVAASSETGGTVSLVELFPRTDGRLLEFFTVQGVPPDDVLDIVDDASAIDEARLVRAIDDSSLFEFVVSGPCIAGTLAEAGAVVCEAVATDGVGRVRAAVPPHVDVRAVVETVAERHEADLIARRERDRSAPIAMRTSFRARVLERLTDRQREAVETALSAGYFRWPREATAEECASRLGIAQPTFTQHLRVGERKVLEALFDDRGRHHPEPVVR